MNVNARPPGRVTLAEAAEAVGVTRQALMGAIERGRLTSIRPDLGLGERNPHYVRLADVIAYIGQRPQRTKPGRKPKPTA